MKKCIKMGLIVAVILVGVVFLDTLHAKIFNNSPIISKKEYYDRDNWIAKGILINTYHCVDENNTLMMEYKLKNTKYMCPIKLNDFELSINVHSDTERKKYLLLIIMLWIIILLIHNLMYFYLKMEVNLILKQL